MSNVGFKRGSQENLDGLSSYLDGYFYLTTDTNRLYVAKSESELVDLTSSINIVDNFLGLPLDVNAKKGDAIEDSELTIQLDGGAITGGSFCYVKDKNLLLICDGIQDDGSISWAQMNPDTNDNIDTTVTGLSAAKSAESSKTQLIYNITLKQTKNDLIKKSSAVIDDVVGNLIISSDDLTSIATDVEVGVSSSVNAEDNSITISTSGTGAGDSDIVIKGGDSITFSVDENNSNVVVLEANIPEYTPVMKVDENDKSKLVFGLAEGDDESKLVTTDSLIYNTITVDGEQKTVNNQGDLGSFYSAGQIDERLEGLNAMSYKGTLGAGEDATANELPTENVKIGDTFMVMDEGDYAGYENCKPGDLFIAFGPEGEDGTINEDELKWVYISAGLDTDTTYSFSCSDNAVKVKASTDEEYSDVFKIKAGNNISVSTTNSEITVGHAASGVLAKAYGPSQNVTLSNGGEFSVPGVIVDAQGHITSAANYKYTLPSALAWEEF